MRLILLVAGVCLAGCADRSGAAWFKPDTTAAQTDRDLSSCRRWADNQFDPGRTAEAEIATSGFPAAERDAQRRKLNALVASCMDARGYVKR